MEFLIHEISVLVIKISPQFVKGSFFQKVVMHPQLFVKRSQNIRVENALHKQFEKAYMCFRTRRASTRDFTVYHVLKEESEMNLDYLYGILDSF